MDVVDGEYREQLGSIFYIGEIKYLGVFKLEHFQKFSNISNCEMDDGGILPHQLFEECRLIRLTF